METGALGAASPAVETIARNEPSQAGGPSATMARWALLPAFLAAMLFGVRPSWVDEPCLGDKPVCAEQSTNDGLASLNRHRETPDGQQHRRVVRRQRANVRQSLGDLALRLDEALPRSGDLDWRTQRFVDFADIRAFAHEVRTEFAGLHMDHDIEWVAVAHDWPSNALVILADRDLTGLKGVATFRVSDATLTYALGPLVLRKQKVKQLKLYQGLASKRTNNRTAIDACFEALGEVIPSDAVVFIGAVETASDLYRALMSRGPLRRRFHVLSWGGETQHCRIRWQASFETYLSSLGKVTRKDLRRNARALFADPAHKCEVRRFHTSEEVEEFLRDGIAVSDKTYQKRDLGLGIALGGAVERMIRFAALRAAFLGYILYIDGRPAAFEYGFLCGRTFTMKQAGYDPAWADRQIGSVLFHEVIRDFERIGLQADTLDLMPDINLFKLRTTNDKRQIQHFYLFPKSFVGTARFLTLSVTNAVAQTIGPWLKRRTPGELERYVARAEKGWRKPSTRLQA